METITEIKERLLALAAKMLKKEGYITDDADVLLELRVAGFQMKYDGWSFKIEGQDWDEIFAVSWGQPEKELLELLKKSENQPIPVPYTSSREVGGIKVINKAFKLNGLPYLLTKVVPSPNSKSWDSTYRIFIRP